MNLEITLKKPHPAQKQILDNAKRFNHLRCGRRMGKTSLIEELCMPAIEGFPVGVWFPTYKDLSEVWKDLKFTYRNIIQKKDEQLHQIQLYGKGIIDFWSLDNPDSGQGRKYKRSIIDEAAKTNNLYEGWENTIRPTLTDFQGDAFILSRPKGKNNDFHKLELKHRKFDNWAFFHFTTYDNPFIAREEIELARQQLDDLTFRQEYLAEYVDANDKPYLYSFDTKKHIIKSYESNQHLPLLISFDFNVEPMTCTVSQQPNYKSSVTFNQFKLSNGSTPELCEFILASYPQYLFKTDVTGDATGQNRNAMIRGNINHYHIIKEKLQLQEKNLLIPKQNMSHMNSRILCNSVLQNAQVAITQNCTDVIDDCIFASVDDQGDLIKTQSRGLHFFDNFRYTIHAAFPDFIKSPHKYMD